MIHTENIFPRRLKEARKAKGLTIAGLAEATYTSVASMWGYENGKTFPSIDIASKIATVLGVSLDYLAGLRDTPQPITAEELELAKIILLRNGTPFIKEAVGEELDRRAAEHGICRKPGETDAELKENLRKRLLDKN